MSETPDNKVMDGAPAKGASLSETAAPAGGEQSAPRMQVTRGGKARPNVAGAKRVRPSAPVTPAGNSAPAAPLQQEVSASDEQPAPQPSARPSVSASSRDSAADVRSRAKVKEKKSLGPVGIGIIVVVCLLLVAAATCASLRWMLPDDVADFQGTWTADDTTGTIEITESSMDLAGQATYQYSLDTFAKTVDASFFSMEGKAHYRFSRDRQSLAIIESKDCSWTATLWSDLGWMAGDFVAMVQKEPYDPLGSETGVTLHRQ